jgi:hypothetical protein
MKFIIAMLVTLFLSFSLYAETKKVCVQNKGNFLIDVTFVKYNYTTSVFDTEFHGLISSVTNSTVCSTDFDPSAGDAVALLVEHYVFVTKQQVCAMDSLINNTKLDVTGWIYNAQCEVVKI